MTADKPLFISLIPNLIQGQGHIVPYHRAVQQAITPLDWSHRVWIPALGAEKIEELDALEVAPVLSDLDLEAEATSWEKILRFPQSILWGQPLAQALKRLLTEAATKDRPVILFMERFVHWQLLGLTGAIWQLPSAQRQQLYLWLLYRRDVHHDKSLPLYQWLHQRLFQALDYPRCQFFTDSTPLQRSLQQVFQVPVNVMPIPHTDFPETRSLSSQPESIYCWWPGAPREEKGWSVLRQLVAHTAPQETPIHLVVAKAAQLQPHPQSVNLITVNDRLSREDYANWLDRSQIILLPYDEVPYQERTSGIFTEAIIAGRIPLVTAGTWMAHELAPFELQDLIIDWADGEAVWKQIPKILADADLQQRLQTMQQAYRDFHSLAGYGRQFQQQWQGH